ncbi:MAG: response regulator [Deltaproteobacteria bacterium]|jgi:CheY-like chemotaxis protein|nr:response regulator [Deltaproteobacteria bacterium]
MNQALVAPEVLVVDDDELTRRLVGSVLVKGGYECLFASQGDEGLEMARAHRPRLIILDIIMPGLNGFEVMRLLKASPITASIPVIFLTGQVHQADRGQALDLGAVDYVEKPFERYELLTRVDSYVKNRRQNHNNLNYFNERLTRLTQEALALLTSSEEFDVVGDSPATCSRRLLGKIDEAVDKLTFLKPAGVSGLNDALDDLRSHLAEIRDLADHLAIIAGWSTH